MASKARRSDTESMCEKTMKIVVNIMKLSSLSIAKKSLPNPSGTGRVAIEDYRPKRDTFVQISSFSVDDEQRFKEPAQKFKRSAYRLKPNEEKAASTVIHTATDVDGKALDYIQRFHERNRIHHTSDLKVPPNVIVPPPPRRIK